VSRIERLAALLDEPLLVAGPPYVLGGQANVRYLTGLASSNSAVLVEPDGAATLFADFRYAKRGREVPGVTFVETARNLLASIGEHLSGRRVGFEEAHLPYAGYRMLADAGVDTFPAGGLVESLRAVKDEREIEIMRRACALSDQIFEALSHERFTGRTERELVWWVERSFRDAGAEGISFPTVVAAGETGTSPHADPGDRAIEEGVLVTVDAGCIVDGYCSDCTRTWATGELPDDLAAAYELVRSAQAAALDAVRPGPRGREVDAVAREIIEQAGHGEHFGHGLGHGVGLDVHEAPRLARTAEAPLVAGNVVTVEPGVYLPGRGGVRIEDLVVVADDGRRVLSGQTKDLVRVD
jgi:Xaa-Pro aminopeptidase